ncbi:MAG: Omp28 family outer membrane lipoprotein [Prevotella sp.]|nr:Omp28 family outer membrane lipoprotein [Prevotella sp.]
MKANTIYRLFSGICICCAIVAAACSNIDESERLIYVEPAVAVDTTEVNPYADLDSLYNLPVSPVARRVLIEDHTGQKCPNCPDAANMIHEFQAAYGDLIVPVAIHSQMQGIMEPEGLGNELGNTYYNYWKIEFKPAGLISRVDGGDGKVLDKTIWIFALQYILPLETPLDIRVKAIQNADDPAKADIDVKVIGTREGQSVNGKLQVWITEDNIVAEQDNMGTHVADYRHDHVLRAAVNGDWGEAVSISGFEDQKEFHYTANLKSAWKPADLAIVAFVYNDDEVVQVVRQPLRIED